MWTGDLEAEAWDHVTNACHISEQGDVEHFDGPRTIEESAAFLDEVRGTHVGHAAGIYDTLLWTQARGVPWAEITMSGGAVLTAKDGSLRIRDSYRLMNISLKKIGQALDKLDRDRGADARAAPGTWLKKEIDRSQIKKLTWTERRAYVESDTAILMEAVLSCRGYMESRGARPTWTAGSSALQLLQTLEPASWSVLKAHALELKTAIAAGACVRGARVETWALGRVEGVWCYDVKSAYPAAYAREPVGVGAVHLGPHDKHRPGTVWRVRWHWPWRGGEDKCPCRIPPVLDQATGAGAGWCEAWVIEEEYAELARFVSVQKIEGWAPLAMAPIGQLFVRDLYLEKENGSPFAKLFLNSLHGKYGTQPIREAWVSGAEPTKFYGPNPKKVGDYWRHLTVSVDKRGRCPPEVQPLAAAHILGRARIRLWKLIAAIVAAGWEVYYSDTDSIHTNCPPEKMPMRLGTAMGDLAKDGGPFTCYYLGPKSYCAVDPTTGKVQKGACKGMPWGSLEKGVMHRDRLWGNVYRQHRDEDADRKVEPQDLRLAVFEEALTRVGGARIVKEGIASWRQGLRRSAGWSRSELTRTLEPHERGKVFKRGGPPTAWSYRSPAELWAGRGLDLSADPFLVRNPADPDDEDDDLIDDLWGPR